MGFSERDIESFTYTKRVITVIYAAWLLDCHNFARCQLKLKEILLPTCLSCSVCRLFCTKASHLIWHWYWKMLHAAPLNGVILTSSSLMWRNINCNDGVETASRIQASGWMLPMTVVTCESKCRYTGHTVNIRNVLLTWVWCSPV